MTIEETELVERTCPICTSKPLIAEGDDMWFCPVCSAHFDDGEVDPAGTDDIFGDGGE